MAKRVAVVLFNLGGPDGPADVEGFLRNLFSDKAIIRAPGPIRWILARVISRSRAASARENYAKMGGGSPLLAETRRQSDALEAALAAKGLEAKCFIAMRYWSPYVEDAVREVADWRPDEIVLLPLYPQFSTTTTGSSLTEWRKCGGPAARAVCCYPGEPGFLKAHAEKLIQVWESGGRPEKVRALLSAHGLPEQVVKSGDPYQWQIEETVARLKPMLPPEWETEICYQSRVGPLKWIGPPTDDAIRRAAADGRSILLSPIAFVSEHIETLVELDDEYREVAEDAGVHVYLRAPALGVTGSFVDGLAELVEQTLADGEPIRSHCGGRLCPAQWRDCPNRRPMVEAW
ncbi:ferrochelatase [bacterium]|nr:ferrochelatase [bacterium]